MTNVSCEMPVVSYEIAKLDDAFSQWEELLALIHSAFEPMVGTIDPPSSAFALTAETLRNKARDETCFAALHDETLAGCLFVAERLDHVYLGKLAVAPKEQGCGLGRLLIDHAATYACSIGKPVLQLQTRVELVRNQIFFEHLGFQEVGRTAHASFSRPTSITYRKTLA